jgi:hypothetical protein
LGQRGDRRRRRSVPRHPGHGDEHEDEVEGDGASGGHGGSMECRVWSVAWGKPGCRVEGMGGKGKPVEEWRTEWRAGGGRIEPEWNLRAQVGLTTLGQAAVAAAVRSTLTGAVKA